MKAILVLACVLLGLLSVNLMQAQNLTNAESKTPITLADSKIPIDYLDLLLDPLTKDELFVEAKRWRDLVSAKVKEISIQEIATREKNKAIADAKADTKTAPQEATTNATTNATEVQKEQKAEILETLADLRNERSALLERLKTVLDAYEKKGGDAKEFRQYASAVSGIKVEVTDTSATWTAVEGWITSKEGGLKWGLRALRFLGIIIVARIVAWLIGLLVRKATSRNEKMSDLLRLFLDKAAQRVIFLVGILIAFSALGVQVGALLALVGGGAFIIGFALQDTLGNFAAGMMLLLYRPFDVDDSVQAGGVTGKVDNVNLVSTTIRTFDNKVVLVPNKQVWGQVIINITGATQRRADMIFSISYSDNVDKAKVILEKVVAEHPLVLKDPAPIIELNELGTSGVNFICRPWAKTQDLERVQWDITMRVKKEFEAEGITFPCPQRDVCIPQVPAKSEAPAATRT